jgi:signal peptidase II
MITKRVIPFGLSFGGVVVLDILSKQAILQQLPLYQVQPVIPGFFNLVHIRNRGMAFGIFGSASASWKDLLLLLFPLIAVAGIFWLLFRYPKVTSGMALALGAVLGGALGNLLDRLRFQEVVDFLDFYWRGFHWPAFNAADSAITLGVGFLVYYFWREG